MAKDTITRTVRLEISKPVEHLCGAKKLPDDSCTWDVLGSELHLYRSVMHRLYNAAIFGTAVEREVGEQVYVLDGKSRTYQMILKTIKELREWGVKEGNRFADLAPWSQSLAICANEAQQQLDKWAKGRKRSRIPSYKLGAPIPQNTDVFRVFEQEGSILAHIKLTSKESWLVRITGSKSCQWAGIRELLRPDVKIGCGKILYDQRRKKWYLLVPYTAPKPIVKGTKNVLVVHRGCRNWITAMSTNGHFSYVARGNKYLAQRTAIKARQRSVQCITRTERGSGSKGHGRRRRYRINDALSDKLSRLNKTYCQQLASRVATLAKEWGCSTVVIENYGGIQPDDERHVRRFVERFPLYQLKEAIAWALKKEGGNLEEVPSDYISSKCPNCGHTDACQHNWRTGVFHCTACGLERQADFVAAYNMMKSTGRPTPAWDKKIRAVESIRKKAKAA